MAERNETVRLLLVEDNPYDAEMIIEELQRGGIIPKWLRVQTAVELSAQLDAADYDIVISDYHLPAFSGPEALSIVQNSGRDIPFIVVSGAIGEETAVEMMKSGVHDYLMKENLKRLPEAVRREIREARIREDNRRANKQIVEALREKEILIKEIHHRVKNNLQIIISMINLQGHKAKSREFIEESTVLKNRVFAIARVHELMYRSHDFSRIQFSEYIKTIADYLSDLFGATSRGISMHIEAEPLELTLELAIPCGLIINELLTNSLKHAFSESREADKKILLGIHKNERTITMTIAYNGSGRHPVDEMDVEEMSGLRLTNLLVQQIAGSMHTTCEEGTKTTVVFEMKQ